MTTFTMQDLNQMPVTQEEEEAMQALAKLGAGVDLGEMFKEMGEVLPNPHPFKDAFKVEPVSKEEWMQQACPPQPSQVSPEAVIDEMLYSIKQSLLLLATVIKGNSQNTTPPEGNPPSLQECVATTLQQADWFRDMVRQELVALDIEAYAIEATKDVVEHEVEHYFDHRFDCTDHFDFNDAVADAVDDRLDDIVRDRVMDSLEEVVAEKLSEASISINF